MIDVDLPVVRMESHATVDGQEITADSPHGGDEGLFRRVDAQTGKEVFGWPPDSSDFDWQARIVAGTYDLYCERRDYDNVSGGGFWPVNDVRRLGCVILP